MNASFYFAPHETFGPTLSKIEFDCPGIGSAVFTRTIEGARREHWRLYSKGFPARSLAIHFPAGRLLPFVEYRESVYRKAGKSERRRIQTFLFIAHAAIQSIADFLDGARFLGPFRTPPRRMYAFGGFGAESTGLSGENAVDLLITEALTRSATERDLIKQVSLWLRNLGVAREIRIHDLARKANLFEVKLGGAGHARQANFADVGFGVSQLLPVLIQGLLTPRGGLYVVQQPELHLHPDAQAGLADFFLFLAKNGVRTLVETHSEYLLVRLRRRLAEASVDQGKLEAQRVGGSQVSTNSVAVLLARENAREGNKVEELRIGESFQFENLPNRFMSQSIEDRMGILDALARANS